MGNLRKVKKRFSFSGMDAKDKRRILKGKAEEKNKKLIRTSNLIVVVDKKWQEERDKKNAEKNIN